MPGQVKTYRNITFFAVVVFCKCALSLEGNESTLSQVYKEFCAGNTIEKSQVAKDLTLPVRLLTENKKSDLELLNSKYSNGASEMSEEDKVVFAHLLFTSNSTELEKIKKVLSFASKDAITESYRKFYDGNLDFLVASTSEGYKKMSDAVSTLPILDSRILLSFFGMALDREVSPDSLTKYLQEIAKYSDEDPFKVNLLAFQSYISKKSYDVSEMKALATKAYELCSRDSSVALGYGIVQYLDEKKLESAKEILLNISEKNDFYSPLVNLYLAQIFNDLGQKELFEMQLQKAKLGLGYLGPKDRKILSELESKLVSKNLSSLEKVLLAFKYVLIVGVLILIGLVLRKKFRK